MEEKLEHLFQDCKDELENIGISLKDVGQINICISKRNNKRYGCCKQKDPNLETMYKSKRRIYYREYKKHYIEISEWVLNLNENIIKNTIIHELIHCLPDCNNHKKQFKYYASIVNERLGYNIARLGNKQEDFEKSNIEYKSENNYYNYKILCTKCNKIYYRKRLSKDFFTKYRCGKCKSKLKLIENKK